MTWACPKLFIAIEKQPTLVKPGALVVGIRKNCILNKVAFYNMQLYNYIIYYFLIPWISYVQDENYDYNLLRAFDHLIMIHHLNLDKSLGVTRFDSAMKNNSKNFFESCLLKTEVHFPEKFWISEQLFFCSPSNELFKKFKNKTWLHINS